MAFSVLTSIHKVQLVDCSVSSPFGKTCKNTKKKCTLSCSSTSFSTSDFSVERNSGADDFDYSDDVGDSSISQNFSYSRAAASVRWPHLKLSETYPTPKTQFRIVSSPLANVEKSAVINEGVENSEDNVGTQNLKVVAEDVNDDEKQTVLGRVSRTRVKKMNKLALRRANDWKERVKFWTNRILALKSDEFVNAVLDDREVQMTPTDFCFVVKWVGQSSWQRALEVYEWLNLRQWYSSNARMLATILAVLGKANQEALAVEIFTKRDPAACNTVRVYNAMMGVYARGGRFSKVQELIDEMRQRGCEPDIVSFNTLINSRVKSGPMIPNLAIELLNEVRRSGLRPDIVTYNTLISACSRGSNLDEAMTIYRDMEMQKCQPDLWTYNAMISVYGRFGLASNAEQLFNELESKGFIPDAVTYNSLLYAFAKEGNIEKVKSICEGMVKMGFGRDEMTYNTIIHMYGKKGQNDLALKVYQDMKISGRNPDAITYTVLIDSLGKANRITEAANVMLEMMDAGVKPTLHAYSALICGYAKVGKRVEAEETFDCMLRSGVRPDFLAYSVMLDIYVRFEEIDKAVSLYQEMVRDGLLPDQSLYGHMLRALVRQSKWETIEELVRDLESSAMDAQVISSILVKGECYDHAAKILKVAIINGCKLDRENLLSILSSYSSSGRYSEACQVLEFLREHAPARNQLLSEALIVILCKAQKLNAALEEYYINRRFGSGSRSCDLYECLIEGCKQNELFETASQIFSDMRFNSVQPSQSLYQSMVLIYCKMGYPETAHHLVYQAEKNSVQLDQVSIHVDIIEAYGKLKLWQQAENSVGSLRQKYSRVDRKVWNALIHCYALSGCYERARAVFNTMMRDGPSPTVDSINGLLKALIVDGRLNELHVVIQELQEMGFQISKSSILLMLEAFARAGKIFEVLKIYHGMKAAGYFPNMHLYRIMIGLLCREKRVRDAEAMFSELEEAGFKPDLSIWNSMLKLYAAVEDFKSIALVYQKIQDAGIKPDADTYNTLIIMYCRDGRPEEGMSLMCEMSEVNLEPKLDTYKSLIAAFGKQQLGKEAEELFEELRSKGYKLDRSFYHIMMKIYRNSGNHVKAGNLLGLMKEAGVEPTAATMHLLMVSYGSAGQPQEAEMVLNSLKTNGGLDTLPYSSVIDAYLKHGDFKAGVEKLVEMRKEGIEPDHRIWTCLIRAASLCPSTNEAIFLLNALEEAGFQLPVRLLTEKSESLVLEVDQCLESLEPLEDNAALNFVNALVDLLWAFELRATASWVFQLATLRNIYQNDIYRVADKDWRADFRKLSGGSALVGLTLWLDNMQDASLQDNPKSPKLVVLVTGTSEYNKVSLHSTLKACLLEMGSPFYPRKTRTGILIAKAHSLKMWLKDSPFCLDLELKDSRVLPQLNSMQLLDGCFIRRGLVSAFKDITERLGFVSSKKFARLALLPDDKRDKAIEADIQGRKEKLEKLKKKPNRKQLKKIKKLKKRYYVRTAMLLKQ